MILSIPSTNTIVIDCRNSSWTLRRLPDRLPFARKPVDLGSLDVDVSQPEGIYVAQVVLMDPRSFDEFAHDLTAPQSWLPGRTGRIVRSEVCIGTVHDRAFDQHVADGVICAEVCAPSRPSLYINPEGHNYARYVAASW